MPRKAEPAPEHDPRNLIGLLRDEVAQRVESGFDLSALQGRNEAALGGEGDPAEALDLLEATSRLAGWRFDEPSDIAVIVERLPASGQADVIPESELRRRLRGAWVGRCAGCILGKPVEGWTRGDIGRYLASSRALPLRDFIPAQEAQPESFPPFKGSWAETTRGRVDGAARDEDVDYTILGLHLLESRGMDFTSADVVAELVDHLPFGQVYTAERVTYANVIRGLEPPATAIRRNPYREWIGALIRADIYGYVAAGRPREAALLAYRDASTSHVGNGIYAAMWSAALVAASFAAGSTEEAAVEALRHIPQDTRLAEALSIVLDAWSAHREWETVMDQIDETYGHYSWVHSIPNAAAIEAAILWSGGSHLDGVALAVLAGRDTDSTGATVGSVLGAFRGIESVASVLAEPLHDRVRSAIAGFDGASISGLAERTLDLALQFRRSCAAIGVG